MKFTKDQLSAINHVYGPSLILAVPGSGKTTVLIHRTYNLINEHKIDPKSILSITFSKSSAIDMKSRFIDLFPDVSNNTPFFATIHSFCFSIIRRYSKKYKKDFVLIEDLDQPQNKHRLLEQIYMEVNNSRITEDAMNDLLNNIGFIKNMMITVDYFLEHYDTNVINFKDIYLKYEKTKRKNNFIDFDDMLTYSLSILKKDKSFLDMYKNQFKFFQVDEAQDTSRLQIELIKTLAYPENNLFVVADDDQSIYQFRGAYPQELLNFSKIYPDSKVFFMEENFRSSSNIVKLSNNFIKKNEDRYKKNIFTNNTSSSNPTIYTAKSSMDQYQYIIDDLKDKDIRKSCVLYRNNMSSIGLASLLDKNNIPFYSKDSNQKFFNHWVIGDIINFLKFAEDPSDLASFEQIYYKMKGFISRKQIDYAYKLNPRLGVFDRILDFPEINYYYRNTLEELDIDFGILRKLSLDRAISFIENQLEYNSYLEENAMKFGNNYENLSKIVYFLKILAQNAENLDELLANLSKLRNLYQKAPNNEGLTLSTIHSAKGLEFDNVYIIDLIDSEFPNIQLINNSSRDAKEEIEEERRLFYVAMTRAKKELNLITLERINGIKVQPSIFIDEIKELNKPASK